MKNNEKNIPIVFVIGSGIRGKEQLTLEAVSYIKKSDKVLFFPNGSLNEEWLINGLHVKNTESLALQYKDGAKDTDNYNRILSRIIDSTKEHKILSVLVPGHPRVGVSWIRELYEEDSKGRLKVYIIEGISSFDTMISDLMNDPLEKGSVIIDANRLLLNRIKLDSRLNYFIYHICSVSTSKTHYSNPTLENRIDLLKEYLLESFDPEHEIIIIQTGERSGIDHINITTTLKQLGDYITSITFATTLFIPGEKASKEKQDNSFKEILLK